MTPDAAPPDNDDDLTPRERSILQALDNRLLRFKRNMVERLGAVGAAAILTVAITVFSFVVSLIIYEIADIDYMHYRVALVLPIVAPLVTAFPTTLIIHRLVAAMLVREQQDARHRDALRAAAMSAAVEREKAERARQATSAVLASMSHELRTPLNAIIGGAELIGKQTLGPISDNRYVDYAEDITVSGKHLLDLINDILDLEKLERGVRTYRRENVPVSDLLDDVGNMMRGRARQQGLTLTIAQPASPLFILAEEQATRQVLLNLLSNAIKFTPRGGSVVLEAAPAGDQVEIRVTDTGIGIPNDMQNRVFEPFTQVDDVMVRKQEGTGLGLSLVRAMTEQQEGSVHLKSVVGTGSTFAIRLPRAADPA